MKNSAYYGGRSTAARMETDATATLSEVTGAPMSARGGDAGDYKKRRLCRPHARCGSFLEFSLICRQTLAHADACKVINANRLQEHATAISSVTGQRHRDEHCRRADVNSRQVLPMTFSYAEAERRTHLLLYIFIDGYAAMSSSEARRRATDNIFGQRKIEDYRFGVSIITLSRA